jgi:HK97 family phage prohead protease
MLLHEELRKHVGTLSLVSGALEDIVVRAAEPADPGEAAEAAEPDIIFSGHAIVYDVLSDELGGRYYSFREKIARGAARKCLDDNQDVVYLYDHEGLVLSRTTAKTMELREDPRGLFVYARATPTTPAEDLAMAMKAGNVRHMSFAFTVAEDTWEETTHEDGTVEVVRTVTKIDRLFDVSAVGQPAYPQTDASTRNREQRSPLRERVARKYGLTPPNLPDSLDELAQRVASTGGEDLEARKAALRELQDGAKRRLALAQARSNTP